MQLPRIRRCEWIFERTLGLLLHEFHAAIQSASVFRVVRSHGCIRTCSERLEAVGADVILRGEHLHNCGRPAPREIEIRGQHADVIGVTDDIDLQFGVLLQKLGDFLERAQIPA